MNPNDSTTTRPGSVTAAVYIQYALVALSVVGAILNVVFGDTVNKAVKAELESADATKMQLDAMANVGGAGVGSLVIAAVTAVLFLVVTILVANGKQFARVLTWVLSGLSGLMALLGLMGMLFLSGMDDVTSKATQAGYDAVGGWYEPWGVFSVAVSAFGSLAVIVLLAMPASHPFFRKSQPEAVLPPEAYAQNN